MPGLQQLWSLTPGNNQTADPQVNLREGWAPSQANDSARMMMAKLKAYVLDTHGNLVTGGTSTAFTLTTNEGFTSLVDGMTLSFRPHVANGASPTLAVDGLTAAPLVSAPGVAIGDGRCAAAVKRRAGPGNNVTYNALLIKGVHPDNARQVIGNADLAIRMLRNPEAYREPGTPAERLIEQRAAAG
jgi:hypothetical protein